MKLGGLFGPKPKTLASKKITPKKEQPGPSNLAAAVTPKRKPGEFPVEWPKVRAQQVKDYKPILTLKELEIYLDRCLETGKAGFDWETAANKETRRKWQEYVQGYNKQLAEIDEQLRPLTAQYEEANKEKIATKERAAQRKKLLPLMKPLEAQRKALEKEYEEKRNDYLRSPLDPHRGEICTASIAAAPDEARVIPISHKAGKNFEPDLSRDEARQLVLDTLDRRLFRNKRILKIAVNMSFETKYAAKYKKYILMPVADPLMLWVRTLQIVAPHKIKDPKRPFTGWGLKPATRYVFGVEMNDFKKLLEKRGVNFFDEIDASKGEGLLYSAEDSDYGLQHYDYWDEVAKQIELPEGIPNRNYSEWLHNIEMPFTRVIGLMEYNGMRWDSDQAEVKRQEAEIEQEKAAARIKEIGKEVFDIDINPGKSGKTGDTKALLFDYMSVPAARWGKTGPSLDEEAIIDMKFMLENKLESLDEEEALSMNLPEGWESIDPDTDPHLDKQERQAIRIAKRPVHPYKDQAIELLDLLVTIQKYSTLLSSHVKGREKYVSEVTGRIHANYGPWTETSRLSSWSPNGQNVPRPDNDTLGVRSFYVASPGKVLFFIDFSGFELRILAWKADDGVMIELFNTGGDMHRRTASVLAEKPEEEVTKEERTHAKPGNFGIAYVGTEHALQKTYKTDYGMRKTLDFCAKVVNAVKTAYKGIPKFQRDIALDAREKGFVTTALGYIRLLPNINSANRRERGADERRAANTPIQGSAADFMKRAQNDTYDEIGRGTNLVYDAQQIGADPIKLAEERGEAAPVLVHGKTDLLGQVHDEMIFEMDDDPKLVEAAGAWVKAAMEKEPLPNFPVPIIAEASVGYRWNKKVDLEDWLKEKGA